MPPQKDFVVARSSREQIWSVIKPLSVLFLQIDLVTIHTLGIVELLEL